MALLMGVDEAGYGPNLGPLVVTVTVWQADDAELRHNLYQALAELIGTKADRNFPDRLIVADSKAVYSPQSGLAALEENVLALLATIRTAPQHWSDMWSLVPDGDRQQIRKHSCFANFDRPLPLVASRDRVDQLSQRARDGFADAPVRLLDVRCRAVFPALWNRHLAEHPTKAAVLSHVSLALLCETMAMYPGEPVYVVCDKHGGRDRYQELLQGFVGDTLVEVYGQSRTESVYCWGSKKDRVEVRFCPRAEAYAPTALASMVSKYLRELSMKAFNAFWTKYQPELRPTAGYPTDARRWLEETTAVRQQLGIELDELWRTK